MTDVNNIIDTVAEVYGVEPKEILGRSRNRRISEARQMAIYVIKERTRMSSVDIADIFGMTEPAVFYSVCKIDGLLTLKDKQTRDYHARINMTKEERIRLENRLRKGAVIEQQIIALNEASRLLSQGMKTQSDIRKVIEACEICGGTLFGVFDRKVAALRTEYDNL